MSRYKSRFSSLSTSLSSLSTDPTSPSSSSPPTSHKTLSPSTLLSSPSPTSPSLSSPTRPSRASRAHRSPLTTPTPTSPLSSSASGAVGVGSSSSRIRELMRVAPTSSYSTAKGAAGTTGEGSLRDSRRKLSRSSIPTAAAYNYSQDDDCIGFATLPDQVHRKAIKRGFDFTLMVVGESGLGKSTLVSSLFLKDDLYSDRKIPSVEERVNKTIEIEKHYLEIEERGVKLRLTIVDTPGFNDSLTGNDCYQPVVDYIEQQFDQYFKDESGLNRRNIKDNRVHCCLYFISPFGHGLRQMDIQFMKRMHGLVNIVPIIAKADSLVPTELNKLKHTVLDQIEKNHIRIYEFPECDSDEDEEFKTMDKELKASVPFAIIGSNYIADVNGKKVRARLYPWGIVEVENNNHCDFTKLRQMLISTHMQDLKDITRDIHYENFRAKYIKQQMSREQRERGMTPDLVIASMNASDSKLKRDSMVESDTDRLLQAKDEELERMRAMLSKMQQQLTKKTTAVNGLGNL